MASCRAAPLVIAVLAGMALAGCVSPQARCFAEATAEYRLAWRAARDLEADLARGFSRRPVEIVALAPVTCHDAGVRKTCLVEQRRWQTREVAIDAPAHRDRLVALRAEMDALRPAAMAAAAPCGYDGTAPAP